MIFNDAPDNGKAQTTSVVAGLAFGFGGEEPVKNSWKVDWFDAATGVLNFCGNLVAGPGPNAEGDPAICWSVAKGILEQIGEHLLDAGWKDVDLERLVRNFCDQFGTGLIKGGI